MQTTGKFLAWLLLAGFAFWTNGAAAQTTSIKTEYLMTYVALLDPPYPIDNTLLIVNVQPGRLGEGSEDQRHVHRARRRLA